MSTVERGAGEGGDRRDDGMLRDFIKLILCLVPRIIVRKELIS
jgi:hypothetical protein